MHGRLAILTSGGDAPGMNAAIRAATLVATAAEREMFGVQRGYRGLLDGEFVRLTPADVGGIIREGGTILGSARCKEFHEKDVRDAARRSLQQHGITGLLVVGGNGSLAGAAALSDPRELQQPLQVIGIPASIDNDIGLTSMAIGVDTAMNTIVNACDNISDTASALDRTFLIEVMGRDCGYLAMTSAIASAADAVLFPEAQRSEEQIIETVVRTVQRVRSRRGRTRRVMIVLAEGVKIPTEHLKTRVDERLQELTGKLDRVETRVTILGHVVRGGRPTAFDRLLASRLAGVGVRAILAGETRKMIGWILPIPPENAVVQRSTYDPYCHLADLDAVLAETERMLAGQSPLARWRSQVFGEIEDILAL